MAKTIVYQFEKDALKKRGLSYDDKAFQASLSATLSKHFPLALAKTLRDVSQAAQGEVRKKIRREYKLHTQFIPNSVSQYPFNTSTVKKVADKVKRNKGGNGFVFFRGASTPKYDLGFMVPHELGTFKEAMQTTRLSIPSKEFKRKGIKTPRGRIKGRYTPANLVRGGRVEHDTKRVKVTVIGKRTTFVKFKNGESFDLTKREGKRLVHLYEGNHAKTKQRKTLDFRSTVYRSARQDFKPVLAKHMRKMRLHQK